MKQMKRLVAVVVLAACVPMAASAQTFTTLDNLNFGTLLRSGGVTVVEIDADGSVVFGNANVLTPGFVSEGRYRVNHGVSGLVDISISATNTCDVGVTLTRFPAEWRGIHYANILSTPIVGVPFDDGDILNLGARISYNNDIPEGLCPADFDLTVTVY